MIKRILVMSRAFEKRWCTYGVAHARKRLPLLSRYILTIAMSYYWTASAIMAVCVDWSKAWLPPWQSYFLDAIFQSCFLGVRIAPCLMSQTLFCLWIHPPLAGLHATWTAVFHCEDEGHLRYCIWLQFDIKAIQFFQHIRATAWGHCTITAAVSVIDKSLCSIHKNDCAAL